MATRWGAGDGVAMHGGKGYELEKRNLGRDELRKMAHDAEGKLRSFVERNNHVCDEKACSYFTISYSGDMKSS